jgi:hypothetical protein
VTEFAQARIRRSEGHITGDLVVFLQTNCYTINLETSTIGRVMAFSVHLGKVLGDDGVHDSDLVVYPFSGQSGLRTAGTDVSGVQYFQQAVQDALEQLLTDYLKANFDL